ncbi:uncharacterized protein B0H18DRAFT_671871 [Fomitopsis serialis]|uniref:uncharacterized protein n=1 Tax=Fomitopsis serialis TaxID=139415 RepID=UPI002008137E|nr:uncharacterized protein B0H18DRAFT_671871 [Neoantrodia serialis]KAH9932929.1 hypothetical protein B0H18DRAFT_671871 [Neoantrodia serialis]
MRHNGCHLVICRMPPGGSESSASIRDVHLGLNFEMRPPATQLGRSPGTDSRHRSRTWIPWTDEQPTATTDVWADVDDEATHSSHRDPIKKPSARIYTSKQAGDFPHPAERPLTFCFWCRAPSVYTALPSHSFRLTYIFDAVMLFKSLLFAIVACTFAGSDLTVAAPIPTPHALGTAFAGQRRSIPSLHKTTGNPFSGLGFGTFGITISDSDGGPRKNSTTIDPQFGVAGDGLVQLQPPQDVMVPKSNRISTLAQSS